MNFKHFRILLSSAIIGKRLCRDFNIYFSVLKVTVEMRANQSAGLGSATSVKVSLDDVSTTHKTQLWIKTQQRFHDLDAKTVVPIITKTTVGGDGARDKPEDNSPDFAESAPTSTLQMKWIKGETEKVS